MPQGNVKCIVDLLCASDGQKSAYLWNHVIMMSGMDFSQLGVRTNLLKWMIIKGYRSDI